jgi:GNAT superfamily N-acetyltransferase
MNNLRIRPAYDDDDLAVVMINALNRPEYVLGISDLRAMRALDAQRYRSAMFVAVTPSAEGETVVGAVWYGQPPDLYEPGVWWMTLLVHPAYTRRGVGSALFQHVEASLAPYQPLAFKANVREDRPAAVTFARQRGFVEYWRRWGAVLPLADFDAQRWQAATTPRDPAIVIRDLAGLLREDPDAGRKLHALQTRLDADVPLPDPITVLDYAQYEEIFLRNPHFSLEGTMVALHHGRYIGMSSFMVSGEGTTLDVDLTGVLPEYRGQGLALALKLRGLEWARANGYQRVVVQNDPVNTPMLAINDKLGFVRQPALLRLKRTL